jgi:CDP-glucose 4,6-dehydratase
MELKEDNKILKSNNGHKALNANKEVVIRNPKSIRPWQHVIEPLFGYLELGVKLNTDPIKYAQAYNFGPNTNDALSVEEMVVKSINCWASGTYNLEVNSNNPHEAGLLKLDITKATTELNWKPVFNAQEAIETTINWYKNYYNGINVIKLMQSDIEYYQSKNNE